MRRYRWLYVGLGVILLAGACFRFVGFRWDAQVVVGPEASVEYREQHLHPDERHITAVLSSLELPASLSEYFATATSPCNPYNRGHNSYVYGTAPLMLRLLLGSWLNRTDYDQVHLVGRALSFCCSVLTMLLLFGLGQQLYGRHVALLATALLAVCVLPIQQSHFATVDSMAAMLAMGIVLLAYRYSRGLRSAWTAIGISVFLGLAVATKPDQVLLVGVVIGAAAARCFGTSWRKLWTREVLIVAAMLACAFLVFRVAQPYAFAGPGFWNIKLNPVWLQDLRILQAYASGDVYFPPSLQWRDRIPYLYPLQNIVQWGLGWPLGLAAMAGTVAAVGHVIARRDGRPVLALICVVTVFGFHGGRTTMTMRYFLSIYPILILFASVWLVGLWDRRQQVAGMRRVLYTVVPWLVLTGTVAWAFAFTSIYRHPHTRIVASEWIASHVPAGSVLANEYWDDALPLRRTLDRSRQEDYEIIQLRWTDPESERKLNQVLRQLERSDWIVLSSNRLYDSIPRWPDRYPMTTRYYRNLFDGSLGFELVREVTSYPTFLGIVMPDDAAEEAFHVYDHPKVLLFRKTAGWSREKARSILEESPGPKR